MGKSYRKTPIIGNTCKNSEKWDKCKANRKFRKTTKQALKKENLNLLPYQMNEIYNVWSMAKDGKHYLKTNTNYYKSKKWRRK